MACYLFFEYNHCFNLHCTVFGTVQRCKQTPVTSQPASLRLPHFQAVNEKWFPRNLNPTDCDYQTTWDIGQCALDLRSLQSVNEFHSIFSLSGIMPPFNVSMIIPSLRNLRIATKKESKLANCNLLPPQSRKITLPASRNNLLFGRRTCCDYTAVCRVTSNACNRIRQLGLSGDHTRKKV